MYITKRFKNNQDEALEILRAEANDKIKKKKRRIKN